ncbi:MAG: DUF4124 domain-containing protein [Pseudomonadales bacterium]
MQRVTISLLTIFLLIGHSATKAGIYKWVDANGKVHYSDKVPSQEKAQELDIDLGPVEANPELEQYRQRNRALIKVWDEERNQLQSQQAEQRKQVAQQRQRCAKLQREYDSSRRAGFLYVPRKDGERDIYSDEQRAEYEQQLASYLRKRCKR